MITDAELDAMMSSDSPTTPDRLDVIRQVAKRRRDLARERENLETRLKAVNKRAEELERVALPDLFGRAGIERIDVPPDGNEPGFAAVLTPYYRANIAAAWSDEAKAAGFAALDRIELGDIVKNVVYVDFGRDEADAAKALTDLLDANGIRYKTTRSVPWTTLTAAVRAIYEDGRELDAGTLAAIGATVGRIVTLKDKND